VTGLGASLAITNANDQTYSVAMLSGPIHALNAKIMAPEGDPISPPTPRPNPKRNLTKSPAPKPGVVAECGHATIISKYANDGETLTYRTIFAPDMIDDMVADGCGRFYRGCNVCSVRYGSCDAEEKAACTDAACLEKTCERKMVCSSKFCGSSGREPTCKSRMARTQCLKPLFE